MVIARKLTEREEAARLNLQRIFETEKSKSGLTQQDVNKGCGWTGSVFGQFMQGRLALSPRAIVKLSEFFKCWPSDIDPLISAEFKSPPTDQRDLMQELQRQSDEEIRRVVFQLSRQLSRKDVGVLLQILADRLLDK